MKKKRLVFGTSIGGNTRPEYSPDKQVLTFDTDRKLGYPSKSWIIGDFIILPRLEGYRLVTEEEIRKYPKPDCAVYYVSNINSWRNVANDGEWDHRGGIFYAVPEDFEFDPEYVEPTDEDAKRRPTVEARQSIHQAWIENIKLLAVLDSTVFDKRFACETNNGIINFQYCRMKKGDNK